jgi:hypothetical protein
MTWHEMNAKAIKEKVNRIKLNQFDSKKILFTNFFVWKNT